MKSFDSNDHPLSAEYNRLWKSLVPSEGKCETLEGELLRASSRIYHDYTCNGFGNNWSGALNFLDDNLDIPRKIWALLKPYARGKIRSKCSFDEHDPIMVALEKLSEQVVRHVMLNEPHLHPNPGDMFERQERSI